VVGNDSWARELVYTARFFDAQEALQHGFVSRVTDDPESCMKAAVDLAKLIASKSPVAVSASKKSILFSRDHSVKEGLDHIALLNSSMLQTEDSMIAVMAGMNKEKPQFAKL
jgi:delta(3,5)-delta(2,4)-dienoyl-CoA isomerase